MLEFYYDFLVVYIDKENFCLIECDTDSLYMALSGPNIESVVRPELRQQFEAERGQFLTRVDTEEHIQHDRREPGI